MRKYILLFLISFFIISSCEEVIDLDLEATHPEIVIQGNVYDQPGPYFVTLSKTVDFDDASIYPPVSNALVIISDNRGNKDTLTEISAGTYATSTLTGTPGNTYTLSVFAENETYLAVSTMPNAVNIDSIYLEETQIGGDKQVGIKFKDPADTINYYRFVKFINNEAADGFYTTNDELYDGNNINFSFRSDGPGNSSDEIKTGDTITVWLECIDERVYDYFRTAGGDMAQSATPSNPTSNISNGAYGYFNACAVRSESMIVK